MKQVVLPPEHLYYAESGPIGGVRYIRVDHGIVSCSGRPGVEGQAERPGHILPGYWEELWALLEELCAWDWTGYYGNLTVMDGVKWALDVRWNGHELEASGHHSWPGGRGAFERLLILLEQAGTTTDERWLASQEF
jgi:hypothetical protein